MTTKRHPDGGETLALKKETARSPKEAGRQNDLRNSNKSADPLVGWHALAKPSRDRPPKRSWRRTGGAISPDLLASLLILLVAAVLLLGGLG
ncbi:MAG: hypothetical protein JSR83_11175 [Proteobacteria bacterium]|nr:hypothetical protein [Pseudomonadota bacterium]